MTPERMPGCAGYQGVFLTFTGFWLILTVTAFAVGRWAFGVVAFVLAVAGCAYTGYRWRNPSP